MMLYINRYFSIFLFSLFSSNTLASLWPLWWCKKNLKKVEQKFTKCQLRGTNGQYFVFGRLPSLYTARNGLSYAFLKLGALFQGRNGKLCSFKFTLNYIIKVALRGMEFTVRCYFPSFWLHSSLNICFGKWFFYTAASKSKSCHIYCNLYCFWALFY